MTTARAARYIGVVSIRHCSARRRPVAALAAAAFSLLLGLAAAPVAPALPEDLAPGAPLPFDPAVRRGTLSNGLVYYVRRNVEPRNRAELRLAVRAGSVLELEQQRGFAHFVEHMAFNGTERFAKHEIIEYLESLGSGFGPDLNAYTSFDETVYQLELPTADPEALETGFRILADWAYAIAFDPDEVVQERDVIMEEWRSDRGASARIWDRQLPVLLGDSRYAERRPIGEPEVFTGATAERLREFADAWYRPELMAVAAVGDFDEDRIEAAIRRHFAPPPQGEAEYARARRSEPPVDRPQFPIPDHREARVSVVTDPEASAASFTLYRKLPAEAGQDVAAYRRLVVDGLYGEMINQRLFERRQVADPPYLSASSGRGNLVGSSAVLVARARVDEAGVARGLDVVLEELRRAQAHGFTATELARAKANQLRNIESAYQERDQRPSARLAAEYLRHFLEQEPVPGLEVEYELYQRLLPEIDTAAVDAVADLWAEPGNVVLLVSGPAGISVAAAEAAGVDPQDSEAANAALAAALRAQLAAAVTRAVEPYEDLTGDAPLLARAPQPGAIVGERRLEEIDALEWTLSNGVTVIARQTDFRNDEVLMAATSPGGDSLAANEDYLAAFTAAMIATGSGAGVHDQVALDKLLTGKNVALSPTIGELFEGLNGQASPRDLETLFQLVTLYATAPRFDPTYFASFRSRLQSQVENRDAAPQAVFRDRLRSVLAQDHFRARPLTLEMLEELSLERSRSFYEDRFADFGDFTFIFTGAFDWEELRELSAAYLAALPAAGRREQWRDVGIDPPPGVVDETVRRGLEPLSTTYLIFAGDMEWSRREALTLVLLGDILQIRLRESIREELGGTYSYGAGGSGQALPDEEYEVWVAFDSDPARADELLAAVFAEVEWLQAGAEQSYLDKAKELLRSGREERLRTNHFWLNQIRAAVETGESFAVIGRFEQRLDAVTLDDIAAAARRYLRSDRYVRVILLPEEEPPTESATAAP